MDVFVVEDTGPVDMVQSFQSLIWNMQYYGRSEFEIVVPGTETNVALLKPGTMLCRDVDVLPGEMANVMIVKKQEVTFDKESGWMLKASGAGLNDILSRRVVWTQTTMNGNVVDAIRKVVTDNATDAAGAARSLGIDIVSEVELTEKITEAQCFGQNLAEWIEETAKTADIGWDMSIKAGKKTLRLYRGANRTRDQLGNDPVVFSPNYDNLLTARSEDTIEGFVNAALVGGEGEGTSQKSAVVGDTISGLNRFETYIDGSSVSSNGAIITNAEYLRMLKDYGAEQMKQSQVVKKIEGTVNTQATFVLGRDYFLGDKVEVDNGRGLHAQARIIELIYSEDENGTQIVPTFSEWEVV